MTDEVSTQRLQTASEWLVRLREGPASEAEMLEWVQWCSEDPANAEAFERIQAVWQGFGRLDRGRAKRRARVLWLAVAASLLIGVAIGAAVLQRGVAWPGPQAVVELGAARTNKSAVLADGSALELGAATSVTVDFSGRERNVSMSAGRAYFKVHHDRAHPFVVRAGAFTVTAVGTAFDVRRFGDRLAVTVEEGMVRVERAGYGGLESASWVAEAGDQLTASEYTHGVKIGVVDVRTAAAWREGRLVYDGEPLGSVVDEVNRYAARQVVIRDSRVADLAFNGIVFTSAIDDWLAAVTVTFHLRATRLADGSVLLEPA